MSVTLVPEPGEVGVTGVLGVLGVLGVVGVPGVEGGVVSVLDCEETDWGAGVLSELQAERPSNRAQAGAMIHFMPRV